MTLPSWITVDATNSRLVGAAGQFSGTTKAEANANAQHGLDVFGDAAIADGSLVCAAVLLHLFYDDFEDYTNGDLVNGLGLGDWINLPSPFVDI